MVDINPVNKNTVVNVNSSGSVSEIKTTTPQHYYDGLAKQWAISADKVQGLDYSSKYYAEKSRESAQNAQAYVEQVNNVKNEAITEITTTKNETIDGLFNISNTSKEEILQIEENAIKNIEEIKEDSKELIIKEAQEQLNNIESTGFYMRDDKLYFINSKGEEEEFKSGGAGAVMFDTKISDHILEGEEAKGWALQGTYVSGALYPDFYSKCLEEYKNSSKSWNGSNVSLVGSVVDNQGVLSGFTSGAYALMPSYFTGSLTSFEIVVCVTISGIGTQQSIIANSTTNQATVQLQLLSGGQIELLASSVGSTSWDVSLKTINSVTEGDKYWVKVLFNTTTGYELYLSQDGLTYEPQATNATVKLPKWTEVMAIGNDTPYNSPYWRGSIDLKETYIDVNGSRYWTGANTIAQNSNGHKFYPIAEKSAIDSVYNQYGIADFYGIDEENERIFLPRNKYFAIKNPLQTIPVFGNGITLGLTDTKGHNVGLGQYILGTTQGAVRLSTATYGKNAGDFTNPGSANNGCTFGITTDPTKSGIIADSSNVIRADESKYLYYCVGNTVVNEGKIDVSKVLDEAVLRSSLEEVQVIVETYKNGHSWYRVWSDGWCEQGGGFGTEFTSYTPKTVNFLKPFRDTNYSAFEMQGHNNNLECAAISNKTTGSVTFSGVYNKAGLASWQACGYIK